MEDEIFKQRFEYDQTAEKLHRIRYQPTEDLILKRNAELRANKGVINDLGHKNEGGTWGRQVASIPMSLYYDAIDKGYELDSTDRQIREKAMKRFLASDIGKACLV
jgi:hypothetical protein